MLKVANLTIRYERILALNSISFEVEEGQIVSLIGANGAGKSTVLMAISGIVAKEAGTVLFDNKDITNLKPHLITRLNLAHVPEGRHIFPKLTVEENLISGTIPDRKMTEKTKNERLNEAYSMFPRLEERKFQLGGTLSGGEQQMLAIGRGLMGDPKLIMLDEPSLGLAPILIEEIFNMILRLKDLGRTVLLIEQNAVAALQVSDHTYVLELGNIVLDGAGSELLRNEKVKRAYLGM